MKEKRKRKKNSLNILLGISNLPCYFFFKLVIYQDKVQIIQLSTENYVNTRCDRNGIAKELK